MPPEAPIPLTVIGGYLGSGKTTLINRIIAGQGGRGLCVIVNDFGELDIDAEILHRADGLTLTLANGCVCCSAAAGLYEAFEAAINASPRPEHIMVEASGVADPARLSAIARAEPSLEARAVITVADCLSIAGDIEDRLKKPDILRQLRAADLILLSKADLATANASEQVRNMLADIAPAAPVESLAGPALPDALALAFNTAPNPSRFKMEEPHDPEARYESCSFRCGELEELEAFLRDLEKLPPSVIRFKGIVRQSGKSALWTVDLAGRRASAAPFRGRTPQHSLLSGICEKGTSSEALIEPLLRRHFSDVSRTRGG